MRKGIYIFCFIILGVFFYAEEPVITPIDPPTEIKGTSFFPLFVGAKWEFNITGMNDVKNDSWKIESANLITDSSSGLDKVLGFKLIDEATSSEWYVFENNQYICFYNPQNTGNKIQRVIPVAPALKNNWVDGDDHFNIVQVKDDTVKVTVKNTKEKKDGYEIFKKDIGPIEINEKSGSGANKINYTISLASSNKFSDVDLSSNKVASNNNTNSSSDSKKDSTNIADTNNTSVTENKTNVDSSTSATPKSSDNTYFTDKDKTFSTNDTTNSSASSEANTATNQADNNSITDNQDNANNAIKTDTEQNKTETTEDQDKISDNSINSTNDVTVDNTTEVKKDEFAENKNESSSLSTTTESKDEELYKLVPDDTTSINNSSESSDVNTKKDDNKLTSNEDTSKTNVETNNKLESATDSTNKTNPENNNEKKNITSEIKSSNENDIKEIKYDYITKLTKTKKYIQIGAFTVLKNAQNLYIKAKNSGYSVKIYKDSDGFKRVVIETDNDIEKLLKKLKKEFTSDAFIKH